MTTVEVDPRARYKNKFRLLRSTEFGDSSSEDTSYPKPKMEVTLDQSDLELIRFVLAGKKKTVFFARE